MSLSSNPLGGWFIYHINQSSGPNPILASGEFPDFPTLGQDRRMIYVAFNAFTGRDVQRRLHDAAEKERDVRGGDFYFF